MSESQLLSCWILTRELSTVDPPDWLCYCVQNWIE